MRFIHLAFALVSILTAGAVEEATLETKSENTGLIIAKGLVELLTAFKGTPAPVDNASAELEKLRATGTGASRGQPRNSA